MRNRIAQLCTIHDVYERYRNRKNTKFNVPTVIVFRINYSYHIQNRINGILVICAYTIFIDLHIPYVLLYHKMYTINTYY